MRFLLLTTVLFALRSAATEVRTRIRIAGPGFDHPETHADCVVTSQYKAVEIETWAKGLGNEYYAVWADDILYVQWEITRADQMERSHVRLCNKIKERFNLSKRRRFLVAV